MSYFKVKMHKIRFLLGLRPRSRWGSLQRFPKIVYLYLRGLLLRGGRGKRGTGRGRGVGAGGKRKGRGGGGREGREGEWPRPQIFWRRSAPAWS